jgi:transposase
VADPAEYAKPAVCGPSCTGPWAVALRDIFFALRSGMPWCDLPERYGPHTTVYNRFNRWAKRGVWLRVFEALAAGSPQSMQLIDSSIVRAHQHAAGGKKGARITPLAVLVAD